MKHLIHFCFATALTLALAGPVALKRNPSPPRRMSRKFMIASCRKSIKIPIYDNHSHATFPDDSDMDAQAAPPDESTVMRLRDTNPEFVAAAKSLFGYPYDDFSPEHAKWLIDKKKAAEASGRPLIGTAFWTN